MTFVLFKARNGKWMFNLIARNGCVLVSSEQYSGLSKAKNAIKSVRKCGKAAVAIQEGE